MKKFICFLVSILISANCFSQKCVGIDISHHNKVNWNTLPQEIKFCYIKATEGKTFVDPMYKSHYRGAVKKDIPIGFYHYFRTNISGKEQFKHFDSIISKCPSCLIPAIDVENTNNTFNRQGVKNLKEMINAFYDKYGYYPIIYYGNIEAFYRTVKVTYKCKWWLRHVPGFSIQQTHIKNNLDYNSVSDIMSITQGY